MKKNISLIIITLFMMIVSSSAKENYIQQLSSELKGMDGVKIINVTNSMIKSFSKSKDNSETHKILARLSEKIESITVINVDVKKSNISNNKVSEIRKKLDSNYSEYDLMMELNYNGQNLKVMSDKETKDFVFYKLEKKSIIIINAKGDIEIGDLMNIAVLLASQDEFNK